MNTEYEDVVDRVVCKLTTLTDVIAFLEYAHDKCDFRKKTITGIFYIISDCIDELEGIVK